MAGKLFVVGTPIGNLGDFSPRAVEALESCDFIAAEDTRVSLKLLNHFGIKKPMISYFEHNRREKGEIIVDRILGGETCAIITDAGMPAVSDPGGTQNGQPLLFLSCFGAGQYQSIHCSAPPGSRPVYL